MDDHDHEHEHDHDHEHEHDHAHEHAHDEDHRRSYEFHANENAELVRLVDAMRFVGRAQALLGVLLACATAWLVARRSWGFALLVGSQALFNLLAGKWEVASAVSFRRVVDTKGDDVGHLMTALAQLRKMFTLQKNLMLGVIAMVGVSAVLYVLNGPTPEDLTDGAQGAPPSAPTTP